MTARVPKVGEQGWKNDLHVSVEILATYKNSTESSSAVMSTWVWFCVPGYQPRTLRAEYLTPPEPTVTLTRYIWQHLDLDQLCTSFSPEAIDDFVEAKLERLSDGTWRVTNLKEGG
jgi:hypothetical protein